MLRDSKNHVREQIFQDRAHAKNQEMRCLSYNNPSTERKQEKKMGSVDISRPLEAIEEFERNFQ